MRRGTRFMRSETEELSEYWTPHRDAHGHDLLLDWTWLTTWRRPCKCP